MSSESAEKKFVKLSLSDGPFNKETCDAVCVVSQSIGDISTSALTLIHNSLKNLHGVYKNFYKAGTLSTFPSSDGEVAIVHASIGSNDDDFDDARAFIQAGTSVAEYALSSGFMRPVFVVPPSKIYTNAQLLTILGIMHAVYVPLNVRERKNNQHKLAEIRLHLPTTEKEARDAIIKLASGIQEAFQLCRDIGDGDPMRMAPPRVAEHVKSFFADSSAVKLEVLDDPEVIKKEYPLLAAVNRGASDIPEHKARVIWLEYNNTETPTSFDTNFETLFLVGKGVSMDTGGVDVKVGGAMFGMSRDKYGSAVVAGFFAALNALRPRGIRVRGVMCMVRNNIDGKAYTCDEIILSRSGKLVQIYNTDAEGRLAMVDPLTHCREQALKAKNPHLFTIATLTGHCVLTYGNRSAIIDNGPARGYANMLQATGDAYGQPVEISRLTKEDFAFHRAESEMAELRQANTKPSVQTLRGHITPAAFLMMGSRLDEHTNKSAHPIPYTHIDIGASMGDMPKVTFPNPLLTLIAHHILRRL